MERALIWRPSAIVPILMSSAALAIVIGYLLMFGSARQADEGTAAHLWQLLMAGQAPIIIYFAIRWLPADPRNAVPVLALQIAAALAAVFPIWWLNW